MHCKCPHCHKEINFEKPVLSTFEAMAAQRLISSTCATYFGIKEHLIYAKTRVSKVVAARHIAIYFTIRFCGFDKSKTGFIYGGRHHSTVIFAERRCQYAIDTEQDIYKDLIEIEKIILNALPGELKPVA